MAGSIMSMTISDGIYGTLPFCLSEIVVYLGIPTKQTCGIELLNWKVNLYLGIYVVQICAHSLIIIGGVYVHNMFLLFN